MTTESQKAFEEWARRQSLLLHTVCGEYVGEYPSWAWKGWQASEARIRAMLESDEMVEGVAKSIAKELAKAYPEWADPLITSFDKVTAKAALKAIVEGI